MNRRTLPLTGLIRESKFTVGTISVIVTITFTMLILSPTALAVRQDLQQPEGYVPETAEARFTETMKALTDRLKHWREALKPDGYAPPRDAVRGRNALGSFHQQLAELDPQVRSGFDTLRQQLTARDAAPVMLERQQAMQTKYDERYARFQRLLNDLQSAVGNPGDEIEALDNIIGFLDQYPSGRPQRPFDPDNLPFLNLQPMPDHTPMMSREAYQAAGLLPDDPPEQARVGNHAAAPEASRRGTTGAEDDFDNPDYLAETDEIVITDFIEAKAAELNHDPVEIFHWVRNNVGWLPTWGAQQDSDITLGSERGNAFDIASLLIALLRASDIPARYAHGTIEVDADTFRNWSSGFDDIDSAIALASSGGIPIVGINEGGQIRRVQMEHIWVEVALDYEPSRGANHIEPDNWVPMDPAFKQYEYLEGLDPIEISEIDPDQLAQDFVDSGTVNEEESWVSGFDPQILADAQEQVQADLEAYIENNVEDPTVGDVIGGRKVIVKEYPTVPSALPYRLLVDEARYAAVPEAFQQAITLAFGVSHSGFPVDPITIPWARVNNHKLTVSFSPATEADEQQLEDIYPADAQDLEDLPQTIPSAIEVKPQLKSQGEVVHSGQSLALGEELMLFNQVFLPGRGTVTRPLSVIAGSYMAVGAESGSFSLTNMQRLRSSVEATQETLDTEEPDLIDNLAREDVLGDMFYSGMLSYYSQYSALSNFIGGQNDGSNFLAAGLGLFGYEPRVNTLFGFPRSISHGGVILDLPIASVGVVDNMDPAHQQRHVQFVGALSSTLEHAIPAQLFESDGEPARSVSTIRALSRASASGQKIYELNPENVGDIMPNLNLFHETESEIHQAINAGYHVVVHGNRIEASGWEGAGYMVLDPDTGSGAYKISGGANGAFTAVGYLLTTVSNFINLLKDYADTFGSKIPGFKNLVRFISVAEFIYAALNTGLECESGINAVILFLAIVTILIMVIVQFVAYFANPLAGFFVGLGLDLFIDYIVSISGNCRSRTSHGVYSRSYRYGVAV